MNLKSDFTTIYPTDELLELFDDEPSTFVRLQRLVHASPPNVTARVLDPLQSAAVEKIELVLETIIDSIIDNDKQTSILLKRRDSASFLRRDAAAAAVHDTVVEKTINFPGRTPTEAWRFS